jgi:hypothetical protein
MYSIHWTTHDDPNFEGDMWDTDSLDSAIQQAQAKIDQYPGQSSASIRSSDGQYTYLGESS